MYEFLKLFGGVFLISIGMFMGICSSFILGVMLVIFGVIIEVFMLD